MIANSEGRHQASSTGQPGTRSGWLDVYFEALRPEYEEIVGSVGWELPYPVETQVGSLESLPFPDDHFDAVWLANVLMYFTDDALPGVLAELRRVVRPGGLIVSKEGDGRTGVLYPLPTTPAHYAPLLGLDGIPGIYRSRELHH